MRFNENAEPGAEGSSEWLAEHTVGGMLGGAVVNISEGGDDDMTILSDLSYSTDDAWKDTASRVIRILEFWVESK